MNKKNKKGFSLAELLISLLIISIVLAAAIPTITRRTGASREQIWRWTTSNNDIYFGVGEIQSAILGLSVMPSNVTYFYSDYGDEAEINADSDKLAIVQQFDDDDRTFEKSHIAFYTAAKSPDATATDNIKYSGRLAMDRTNIALGIGSLQTQENSVGGNTALGHYALYHNDYGGNNTAVGYLSLGYLQSAADTESNGSNTAIGMGACSNIISGSNNVCIGNYSGYDPNGGTYMVIPGGQYTDISNRLFIGSNNLKNGEPEYTNADIITGYTYYKTDKYDKELDVNTRNFKIKTFDGAREMFNFTADRGSTGYDTTSSEYTGSTDFNYYINDAGATQISAAADSNHIYFLTSFADSASSSKPYNGTINLNNSALSYTFKDSSYDNSKYKVDMNTDYELGISSTNSTIDVSAIDELNLSAWKGSGSSASITLKANSNNDVIKLSSADGLSINTSKGISIASQTEISISSEEAVNLSSIEETNIYSSSSLNLYSEQDTNINVAQGQAINIGSIIIDSTNNVVTYGGSNGPIMDYGNKTLKNLTDVYVNNQSLREFMSRTFNYSDARLKDISGDNTAGLKEINALEVKNYTFKNDKEKTPHVGVIAQSLQKIFPNSVSEDKKTGYLRIRTEEIFYAMVNSIKELYVQIQDLTAKITGLDKRITQLENENQQLKKQNEDFEKRLSKLEKQKK